MPKRLVVTADDFGLSTEVNEAVELAHRTGILSAASLMVAGPAAADAVARARRMPDLRVGLHVVLVEGRPVLPAAALPDLVDRATGRLRTDLARLGLAITLWMSVRKQVAAEIAAQFEAFRATGLALDHVNAHKHYHLHPLVADELLPIVDRFEAKGLRVPLEPTAVLRRIEPVRLGLEASLARPWASWLRVRARRRKLLVPDGVFGLAWSGALTERRLVGLLEALPPGFSEIYTHPASGGAFAGAAPGYRYADELAGLVSPAAREALRASGARLGGYADVA